MLFFKVLFAFWKICFLSIFSLKTIDNPNYLCYNEVMTKIKNTTNPNKPNIEPNNESKTERPYLIGSIYAGLYERYAQPQTLNLAIHKHNNHHNHFRYLGLLNSQPIIDKYYNATKAGGLISPNLDLYDLINHLYNRTNQSRSRIILTAFNLFDDLLTFVEGEANYPYADMPKSVSANYTIELFFAKSFLHSFRFSFTNPNHTPFQSGLVFTNSRYSGQRETILPDKIFSITDKELHTLLFLLHKYMDSKQSLRCYNIDTYDPYQNKQK